MVKFNVTTESHPAALVPVQVAVLFEELYIVPCHSRLSHAVSVSIDELGEQLLMVKIKVATLSQPAALVPVKVYVPLEVYVVPFHV